MCLRSLWNVVSGLKVKMRYADIDPDFTQKNFYVTIRLHKAIVQCK